MRDMIGWSAAGLFSLGLVASVIGIIHHDVFSLIPTNHFLVQRQLLYTTVLAALILAWILKFSIVGALQLTWMFLIVSYVGFLPTMSAFLLAATAFSIGESILDTNRKGGSQSLSIVCGLGVIAGLVGWLLPFPIHSQIFYAVTLLVILGLLINNSSYEKIGNSLIRHLRSDSTLPGFFAVSAVGLVSVSLWVPDVMFDDLAYHLGLANQLEQWGYYRMDVKSQIWALAPWSSGILNGIVTLISGSSGRAALNLIWFALAISLLWQVSTQLGLSRHLRWWSIAIFASLPLSLVLGSGLQTELPTTVAALAITGLILANPTSPKPQILIAFSILFGFLLALKVSNVLIAMPLSVWALSRWYKAINFRILLLCAPLVFFVAGSSYFYAFYLTGNPVLPLFNDVFRSDYFHASRFTDLRWHHGFDWKLPWAITYQTSNYHEGWAGAAGFILISMIGLIPLALADGKTRPLLMVGLFSVLAPLFFIQYMRYAFPGLILILSPLLYTLQSAPRTYVSILCGLLVGLNLAFHGNVHWSYRDGIVELLLDEDKDKIEQIYIPEKNIAEWVFSEKSEDLRILLVNPNRPFHSIFAGQGFTTSWYDTEIYQATQGMSLFSSDEWIKVLQRFGISHVLVSGDLSQDILAELPFVDMVYSSGTATLFSIDAATSQVDVMEDRDEANKLRSRLRPLMQ